MPFKWLCLKLMLFAAFAERLTVDPLFLQLRAGRWTAAPADAGGGDTNSNAGSEHCASELRRMGRFVEDTALLRLCSSFWSPAICHKVHVALGNSRPWTRSALGLACTQLNSPFTLLDAEGISSKSMLEMELDASLRRKGPKQERIPRPPYYQVPLPKKYYGESASPYAPSPNAHFEDATIWCADSSSVTASPDCHMQCLHPPCSTTTRPPFVHVATRITDDVKAGAKKFSVLNPDGFTVGEKVIIEEGSANEETNEIATVGFATLTLKLPLKVDHASGATVSNINPTTPTAGRHQVVRSTSGTSSSIMVTTTSTTTPFRLPSAPSLPLR